MTELIQDKNTLTAQLNASVRALRKNKVCYGIPSVAEARFKRDIAEAVYKANQEAINSTKLQLRLIDNQLDREWNSGQTV